MNDSARRSRQILGDSETARLVRRMDWSATALGAITAWPDTLLGAVNMVLNAPVPMQLFWGPELICFYNDALLPSLYAKHPSAMGQSVRTVWQEAWATVGPQMERVYKDGTAVSETDMYLPLLKNGRMEDLYWTFSYSPVFGPDGSILGVLNLAQDTTASVLARRAEAEHRRIEKSLTAFARAVNDALYRMSADWSVMYQLQGRDFIADTDSAEPAWLQKYIPAQEHARVQLAVQLAIETRSTFELEHRVLRADGSIGWTFSRAVPLLDDRGDITEWFGAATDISARKEAQEETRQSRERMLLAMDAAGLAAWSYDPARNVVTGDQRMAAFFGLSLTEAPVELWLDAIVEEDRARVRGEFEAAIDGAPYDTEYRVQAHGTAAHGTAGHGDVRWIHAKANLAQHKAHARQLVGICEDITPRKQTEMELHATLQRLALAEKIGNIAVWEWELKTGNVIWDSASAWVFGHPPEDVSHADAVLSTIYVDDLPGVMTALEPALKGTGEFNHEFRVCWPDGSHHWLFGKAIPVLDGDSNVTHLSGVNIDITERRLSEAALRQSEKLAAVGRLASTISHEINNPLEAVTNLLYLIKTDPALTEGSRAYLETAEHELGRVSQITTQTLRFHRRPNTLTTIRPEALLEEVLMLYKSRLVGSQIEVHRDYAPDLNLTCLEGDVRQILNNLIGNAFDAMRDGGCLRIRTCSRTWWRSGRKGVTITIADNGPGIPSTVVSRIFEAFYSTKGMQGTGLGLWISHRIAQKHAGYLRVRSSTQTNRGTTFVLWLPAVAVAVGSE